MKILSSGELQNEKGEPVMRSCWECNPAHEHLKKVNMLHLCFECGRYWIYSQFLDVFKDQKAIVTWLLSEGLSTGDSTGKIDRGYRVTVIKINKRKR